MSPRRHLLDAIIESPEDEEARLIFADWLEESGDPRAQFIRLQCERARHYVDSPEHKRIRQLEEEALLEVVSLWNHELPFKCVTESSFEWGFPQVLAMRASEFLKHGAELYSETPIEWLRLTYLKNQISRLAEAGFLNRLRGLNLSATALPRQRLEALLGSLDCLRRLNFNDAREMSFDAGLGGMLVNSPFSDQLEELYLLGNFVHPSFFAAIRSKLPKLRRLSLRAGHPMSSLANLSSVDLPSLQSLDINGTVNTPAAQEILGLGPLKSYRFLGTFFEHRLIGRMVRDGCFRKAQYIAFHGTSISEQDYSDLMAATRRVGCKVVFEGGLPIHETHLKVDGC